jgi:hypothetical protein
MIRHTGEYFIDIEAVALAEVLTLQVASSSTIRIRLARSMRL